MTGTAEKSRGRLLVVDDEEPQRLMLSNILRRAGFEVETASDGRAALERLGGSRSRAADAEGQPQDTE